MIGQRPPKQTAADERRARAAVKLRDNDRCARCRRPKPALNFDHRLPRGRGGRWTAANGQLLCGSGTTGCHGWKTENPEEATARGYTVPTGIDPTAWPVRRWVPSVYGMLREAWVLYLDERNQFGEWWIEISEAEAAERMGRDVS